MKFLKTTFESAEYNAIQGYQKDKYTKLELIEDADGNWFINSDNKLNTAFSEILSSLNAMEETGAINFKAEKNP